jgi:hypothetical protein
VLASGYLFTSLIVISHTLAFPRAFAPDGLLGGGLQTTGWLHVIWHFMFPTSVIAYAFSKGRAMDAMNSMQSSVKPLIGWSIATVFGVVVALTWGLVAADAFVPRRILDKTTLAPLAAQAGLMDALTAFSLF